MHSQCHTKDAVSDGWSARPPGMSVRLGWLAVAAPCWALLAGAALLTPRAAGYGTHEQLGLPACNFLATTRLPCPTCGLTTSVAAMAHGRILAALRAHPFGAVLVPAAVVLAVAGTAAAVTGRPPAGALRPRLWWVWIAAGGILAGWAAKLITGLADGSLPLR